MRRIPSLIIPVITALFLFAPPGFGGRPAAAQTIPSMIEAPNPWYTPHASRAIDTVVIHFTSAENVNPARWDDPQLNLRIFRQYHVSSHYLIDRMGKIYRLVGERNAAWHAGGSIMPAPDNRHNVNGFSLGIELIATSTSGFSDAQYSSLDWLLGDIRTRHTVRHIVGHDEIAGTRCVRLGLRRDCKPDPGPLFDWSRVR